MPSVHHFRELSATDREEGQSRTMLVHYSELPAVIVETAIGWLWWAVGAGISAVIVLIVLITLFLT